MAQYDLIELASAVRSDHATNARPRAEQPYRVLPSMQLYACLAAVAADAD